MARRSAKPSIHINSFYPQTVVGGPSHRYLYFIDKKIEDLNNSNAQEKRTGTHTTEQN